MNFWPYCPHSYCCRSYLTSTRALQFLSKLLTHTLAPILHFHHLSNTFNTFNTFNTSKPPNHTAIKMSPKPRAQRKKKQQQEPTAEETPAGPSAPTPAADPPKPKPVFEFPGAPMLQPSQPATAPVPAFGTASKVDFNFTGTSNEERDRKHSVRRMRCSPSRS